MRKRLFRPTNRRIRLAVGLLIAGLFCIQCTTPSEAFKESELVQSISGKLVGTISGERLSAIEREAKTDHIALLTRCLEHYQGRYQDYTCTFIKEEVVNGSKKPEQWIDVKFMEEPFSVAMEWTRNAPIAEAILYVEGRYDNKMLVRPRGFFRTIVGDVLRDPAGKQAMQNTRRPVTKFGFKRGLKSLLDVYTTAAENGDLEQSWGGYAEVAGRRTLVLIRRLPAKEDYPAHKTLVYIDVDHLVPVCIEGYNWQDELTSRYIYKDVKFNVALTRDDFLPSANGMKAPS